MRSLWAGVTGLQAHQIAMDVEGNNIANVNTTGYKYSRANFSNLLSQTAKIATAPQGELGGKNSMQIGLGTTVSTVTKIFEQGSIETTDKDTDLAISGDGFFVVSPDGGSTYKYTRNGDFSFDANGNFVDSNGYIIQGWLKDEDTGDIDTTSPISNITIPPGLTTPANATTAVTVKANLDSGSSVGKLKSTIYALDSYSGWVDKNSDGIMQATEVHNEDDTGDNEFNTDKELYERGMDFGVLFDPDGNALNLTDGQGAWISYAKAQTNTTTIVHDASGTTTIDMNINGTAISGSITSTDDAAVATYIAGLINAQTGVTGVEASITGGTGLYLTNDNQTGTEAATKNIKLTVAGTDTTGMASTDVITAYQYTYSDTPLNTTHSYDDSMARTFTTTEDFREAMQRDARLWVDYSGNGTADKNDGVTVTVNASGQFEIANPTGDALNADDGDVIDDTLVTPITITADTVTTQDITFPVGTVIQAGTILSAATVINGTSYPAGALAVAITLTEPATIPSGSTLEASVGTPMTYPAGTNFKSTDDHDLYITVTGLSNATNNVSANESFTTTINALQGTLTSGTSTRTSQSVYAATLASSTDVYDSLGSKHTVRFEFTKTGFTSSGGTEWSIIISVPEPGDINLGNYPENIVTGSISFNSDGSLATFTPRNLTYTANNGSTANQNIEIDFGTLGQFDGITSFDKDSSTSGISQDGYAGGDINGLSVDETGTIIGSFTNGRSFALAQVSMATFTNNGGLESDGGNCYVQTSNSGDPIVGQASTGGKGTIQASSLEMSNVDLSRSLTQLIVIQRGYQANSKTITTADEMLNTLLQLK
ncbi:MAG: Flagellar hook protein FlgE [Proteobacteria bacterium]|nr:Flagellar hook protein FlgE [Pseudomonadota bacterium]